MGGTRNARPKCLSVNCLFRPSFGPAGSRAYRTANLTESVPKTHGWMTLSYVYDILCPPILTITNNHESLQDFRFCSFHSAGVGSSTRTRTQSKTVKMSCTEHIFVGTEMQLGRGMKAPISRQFHILSPQNLDILHDPYYWKITTEVIYNALHKNTRAIRTQEGIAIEHIQMGGKRKRQAHRSRKRATLSLNAFSSLFACLHHIESSTL